LSTEFEIRLVAITNGNVLVRTRLPHWRRSADRAQSPASFPAPPRAPADGVVSVIAAEVGENVRAGQPILMVEAAGKQWLSFNVREDHLNHLAMGETASVIRNGAVGATKAAITELRPLGTFATWQAEGVIGDHERNTLRLGLDPDGEPAGLEPGMTVWIEN
jgi:HlyD family secretion protein